MNIAVFLLVLLSWIAFAAGIGTIVYLFKKQKGMSVSKKILIFSGTLFLSIFLLRLATSVYIDVSLTSNALSDDFISMLGENAINIGFLDHCVRSMIQSLRTFAFDEDFYLFAITADKMKDTVFFSCNALSVIYRVHAAAVTLIAPVTTGAIVIGFLTKLFSKLILKLMPANRDFYVFSELNNSSLALAQSIVDEHKASEEMRKPVIVFTDVYIDTENEVVSERVAAAKNLGAICLTDDILHIKIRGCIRTKRGTKVSYLLMDEIEENNLHTLSMLAEHNKGERLLYSYVYLFGNGASVSNLVKCVDWKLRNEYKIDKDKLPVIRVIEGYKNLVYNLLCEVPLYEPLVGRVPVEGKKEKDLNVTIIGSGIIGMQMFLATYWMGQMLDVNLHINIVSQESEESFRDRVNLINSDILKTEASQADTELLRIYSNSHETAKPYFTMRYTVADVMTGNLYDALNKKHTSGRFALCQSDYFVVAIGSDENNILVANKIKEIIGRDLLCDRTNRRAIINYVVYDKDVCSTLNCVQDNPNIYMNAFGNFRDVYNYNYVFMSRTDKVAVKLNETHAHKSSRYNTYGKEEMNAYVSDEYKYWSSIARGIHIPYKYFSAGAITASAVFDKALPATEDQAVIQDYLRRVCLEDGFEADNLPTVEEREKLYYRLTWLEHRRWVAFIRTCGFSAPDKEQLDAYAFVDGNGTKELSLKFHPCLVECDEFKPKLPAAQPRTGDIAKGVGTDLKCIKVDNYDCLDAVSLYLHKLAQDRVEGIGCVYKAYDCPYEYNPKNKTITIQ